MVQVVYKKKIQTNKENASVQNDTKNNYKAGRDGTQLKVKKTHEE